MAHIGFVSTSVLESKDGIGFNEEVRKESEEVLEAERIAKEADKKPLWEQLAGKRDEKQAKFDAVRASMFAPPRALDDEESNFLQGVEAQRVEARQRKDDWEAEELRGFALARANQTVAIAEPKKPKARPSIDGALGGDEDHQQQRQQQKEGRTGAPPPVVAIKIKAKRKKGKDKDKGEKRAKKRASTSASSTEEVVAHSDIASGKGGEIDRNADGKTDGKAKSDGKSGGGSGDALETPGKAKGKIEGMGALSGGGGGGRDGDGDGDAKDKESGGANLSSLLGAYGSDSDSGGGDA